MREPIDFYHLASLRTSISQDSWDVFSSGLQFHEFKKSDFLVRLGSEQKIIFMIEQGVARNYCLDDKGREYTKTFRGPGGLIGPYAEILENVPSRCFIQAVTPLRAYSFSYSLYQKMMNLYPEWQILARKMAEENFIEKEHREHMLLQLPAIERLKIFRRQFDDFLEHIPQYQIASYLGITPEFLNRLLKKLKT